MIASKKKWGLKDFMLLVGQLKGTEFYRLADRQNDFMMGFGMSDADFAAIISTRTDAGIDVLPSASAALINAGGQNARVDTAGGGTVILNQQRIDASQNQGDTVTVGKEIHAEPRLEFESTSPGGF